MFSHGPTINGSEMFSFLLLDWGKFDKIMLATINEIGVINRFISTN